MKYNYTVTDLQRLAEEATDCDLKRPWNPWNPPGELTWEQFTETRRVAEKLYRRYTQDIWIACTAGFDRRRDSTVFSCLARLELANQVFNPSDFEEFIVRNALKITARQILEDLQTSHQPVTYPPKTGPAEM